MNDHRDRQLALMGELIREQALQLCEAEAKIEELQNVIKQLLKESEEGDEI